MLLWKVEEEESDDVVECGHLRHSLVQPSQPQPKQLTSEKPRPERDDLTLKSELSGTTPPPPGPWSLLQPKHVSSVKGGARLGPASFGTNAKAFQGHIL